MRPTKAAAAAYGHARFDGDIDAFVIQCSAAGGGDMVGPVMVVIRGRFVQSW